MKLSLTITGLIVALLTKFLDASGFQVSSEEITNAIEVVGYFVSAIMVWYGRFRQGDIRWYGAKKN